MLSPRPAASTERLVDGVCGVMTLATSIDFWKYLLLSRPDRIRRLAIYMVAIASALGGTGFYLVVVNPKLLFKIIIWMNRRQCGLKTRKVTDDKGFTFSYAECGVQGRSRQPSLVLVPGLGGTIDNWVPVLKAMKKTTQHIVAVELPGNGDTSCDTSRDLNILAQVDRLHQFLNLVRLAGHPIHLVGAATGGTVVGCYAAMHPKGVTKLTLICPAVRCPIDSDVIIARKKGRDLGLVPRSASQIPNMMKLLSWKPTNIPKQLMDGLFQARIKPSLQHMNKLSDSMYEDIWAGEEDILLTPRLEQITAPTHVIWGRYDRVLHVSGADFVRKKLVNCARFNILDCGHSLYIDEPRQLAQLIQDFVGL